MNSADARLSVFDIRKPAVPVLIAEIPVGLEPVSLAARSDDEVWVVSEVGDSVSVVSLSRGCVVATLHVPDEPADIAFAGGKAFVSGARAGVVAVFDAATRGRLADISLQGNMPRSMAVSGDQSKVYVSFLLSGNRTTILPSDRAPAPPPPANPSLPPAPKTAVIVPADDERVVWEVRDHDVAEITVAENAVTAYHGGAGTILFDVAVRPGSGELWIANTEALNLIRHEPALRGHFADNRLTKFTGGVMTAFDLNPGIDYGVLPNPAAQEIALAQPAALAFTADGGRLWVAAFGSDRIARVNPDTGAVEGRIDVRPAGTGSREMRGPRGLAMHHGSGTLYVLNKLSGTIAVIDTENDRLTGEVRLGASPVPAGVAAGRGFLFDARLSGNGTVSCATCHVDADRDGLAWDLGDPNGGMLNLTGYDNSVHDSTPRVRAMHPMKGPMVTQTLRGFLEDQAFHWRGDRPDIASFNPTFANLMGGSEIAAEDMQLLETYLMTLRHHPNPNRMPDRSLPETFAGGRPARGRDLFNSHLDSHCITCHLLPAGTDGNIDSPREVGSTQPVKTPPLRTVYQRAGFDPRPGAVNTTGFGMLKDGTGNFPLFPVGHFYVLESFSSAQDYTDVRAFVLCFDTGTAPAVGMSITVSAESGHDAPAAAVRTLLENQAGAGACDLVVRGTLEGRPGYWLYDPDSRSWRSDDPAGSAVPAAALIERMRDGDALTFLAVLPGLGARFSIDRDGDGVLNAAEERPDLRVSPTSGAVVLEWPAAPEWYPEAMEPDGRWRPYADREVPSGRIVIPAENRPASRLFRLRRTW